MIDDGPFKEAVLKENCLRKEIVNYYFQDGVMVKQVATRVYKEDGDYHDTWSTYPMTKGTK